jgi:hypothetical protein
MGLLTKALNMVCFSSIALPPDGRPEVRMQSSVSGRAWIGIAFWCLAIAVFAAISPLARSQTASTENKLKAAYLFNFARYTEWPSAALPESDSPITIAILGDDPFGEILDKTVQGRLIDQHPVRVRRTRNLAEAASGHIVFVSPSESARMTDVLGVLNGKPVLTVGNDAQFLKAGGMIHFLIEQDAVRFNVDLDSVEKSGLRIRSRMLDSAKKVIARRSIHKP